MSVPCKLLKKVETSLLKKNEMSPFILVYQGLIKINIDAQFNCHMSSNVNINTLLGNSSLPDILQTLLMKSVENSTKEIIFVFI